MFSILFKSTLKFNVSITHASVVTQLFTFENNLIAFKLVLKSNCIMEIYYRYTHVSIKRFTSDNMKTKNIQQWFVQSSSFYEERETNCEENKMFIDIECVSCFEKFIHF